MANATELTTIYRSADRNADADANAIKNLLLKGGLNPVIVGGEHGVPDGTWEIRVPAVESEMAASMIADVENEPKDTVDPSHDLDLVPVLSAGDGASLSEIEALSIQSVLDASGINSVVIGTSTLPNLGFEVRVARDEADRARQLIEEARAAGPAAASEAQRESEGPAL